MSFNTLLYTGLLVLALFSADVWLHSDIINLDLSLAKSPAISDTSIGEVVGENIFLTEIAQIEAMPTFVAPPRVRSTHEATTVTLFSDMLGLNRLTQLVQRLTGVTPVTISGALIRQKELLQLVLVSNPGTPPAWQINLTVTSTPGEPITRLVQRAAVETMLQYDDYLACLYLLTQALADALGPYEPSLKQPGFQGVDQLIQERLALRAHGLAALSQLAGRSRREAMFVNLRGIIALEQGDPDRAARLFAAAAQAQAEVAVARLNLAFVHIQQGRYPEAIAISQRLLAEDPVKAEPMLAASADTLWGLAAWGLNQVDEAADHFAQAIAVYPHTTTANLYWSELLDERGQADAAAERRRRAQANAIYFSNYAETALAHFRLSPHNQAPMTRF